MLSVEEFPNGPTDCECRLTCCVLAGNEEEEAVLAHGPVAIDVCVRPQTRAVIITGPNTGGKTATLKVTRLSAVLTGCAYYVLCECVLQVRATAETYASDLTKMPL